MTDVPDGFAELISGAITLGLLRWHTLAVEQQVRAHLDDI